MPTLGAPAIAETAIEEFGFRPEMILGQRLGVGLEFAGRNWPGRFAVKCGLRRFPAQGRFLLLVMGTDGSGLQTFIHHRFASTHLYGSAQ
jgi:hypothetical protein